MDREPASVDIYVEYGEVLDTQILHADDIGGIELYGAPGFNPIQTHSFMTGSYFLETISGFENEVFDPFLYLKISLVANFRLEG